MAEGGRLPAESLSPIAERVDEILALYHYELTPTIEAINDVVPGYGGLFDSGTSINVLRSALDNILQEGPSSRPFKHLQDATDQEIVIYVDGSSRGNPGPAGAGAVVQIDNTAVMKLGRPVGSHTDNNLAEYAALQLGLNAVHSQCSPSTVEVRIDSMTVINDTWRGQECIPAYEPYSDAISDLLSGFPSHHWTHLADSDPNPADAHATVGADIAALGPGG